MMKEEPRRPNEVAEAEVHCPACGVRVPGDHPSAWCSRCGRPFPHDVQVLLPRLQAVLRESAAVSRTTRLVVEGREVPCPVCAHDQFWTRESLMESRGAAFFGLAGKAAINYVCDRCGHVLWFLRK